jgi:hypothetical protein
MRTRSTVTAAFALAAATILAVAACGSSVSGSAQPNSAAVVAGAGTTSEPATAAGGTSDRLTLPTAIPTNLSDLASELSGLATAVPTDLSLPNLSNLQDLTSLVPSGVIPSAVPGLSATCAPVYGLTVVLQLMPYLTALGGQTVYDGSDLDSALKDLTDASSQFPPEIAKDIQAIAEVAKAADGKTYAEADELLKSEKFTTAAKDISDWYKANCG